MNALTLTIIIFAAVFLATVIAAVTVLTLRDKARGVKRRKRTAAVLGCCGVLICAAVIWFFLPFRMLSAKPEDVKFIEIFDGTTGEAYTISNEEKIRKLTENFGSVKLVRKKVEWRSGYHLRVAVNYKGGRTVVYIINSERDVVMGNVICEACEGSIDYDYLCSYAG